MEVAAEADTVEAVVEADTAGTNTNYANKPDKADMHHVQLVMLVSW